MANDPLLQAYQLKHLRLKNRMLITSHEPAYAENGMPKARYRAYHVERAKAGVALTMTAGSASVAKDSPPAFNNILAYKDEVVPWLRELTDACHEYDCAVMIQLTHLGRRTTWNTGDWLPSLAPGPHREPAHRAFPKVLEDWDIVRIIDNYADAAQRMQASGMDGIELECYGHLIDQFWTPLTNRLSGPYGTDTLENRLRFLFDVLTAIRKRVGKTFLVGIRYSADETHFGGITPEEGLAIAQKLKDSGMVDFLNIIRGRIYTDAALSKVIPVQGMPSAPHLDFAGAVRKASGMPVFHAAKIADIATARHAIAQGLLDMVGMTRAHIADPHIVQKIMEKREHDIRPCVGANFCLDRIYAGGETLCIHNPASGRELHLAHSIRHATQRKNILVVGAGPAGLEAARVAAERGHKVTVLEAAEQAGGQVRLLAQSPRRREMLSIIDWRMEQCTAKGVEFHFNYWAEKDGVLTFMPDVVVIACGGLPNTELHEQHGACEEVVSAWDILSGATPLGQTVLIYDEVGDHVALQATEFAAEHGVKTELMTPDRSLAQDVMAMSLVPYLRALQALNVRFTLGHRLLAVSREGTQLKANIGSDYSTQCFDAYYDQVVVNYGTFPLDTLYFELKETSSNRGEVDYDALIAGQKQSICSNPEGQFQLFRIGDAVSSRNIHAAIYDALRLMQGV